MKKILIISLLAIVIARTAEAAPVTVKIPMDAFTAHPNPGNELATFTGTVWVWSTSAPARISTVFSVPSGCWLISAKVGGSMWSTWTPLAADIQEWDTGFLYGTSGNLGGGGGSGSYNQSFSAPTSASPRPLRMVVTAQAYGWTFASASYTYDC